MVIKKGETVEILPKMVNRIKRLARRKGFDIEEYGWSYFFQKLTKTGRVTKNILVARLGTKEKPYWTLIWTPPEQPTPLYFKSFEEAMREAESEMKKAENVAEPKRKKSVPKRKVRKKSEPKFILSISLKKEGSKKKREVRITL